MSSTAPFIIDKTPGEALDISIVFTGKLATGEKLISAGTVTSTPSGLTFGAPAVSADGTQIIVNVSGGTLGTTYTIYSKGNTTNQGSPAHVLEGAVIMPIQW